MSSSHRQEITGAAFDDPNLDKEHFVGFDDESPYPEVRSAVANTDDFDMPVTTFRTWAIGLAWAIVIPGLNQFFFFRFPSVSIGGIVAQLLSFPMGRAAAAWLPNVTIFGVKINPGPFTVKEHVLITVRAYSLVSPLTTLTNAIIIDHGQLYISISLELRHDLTLL